MKNTMTDLVRLIVVTAEVTNTTFSAGALEYIARELSVYEAAKVESALRDLARTHKFKLTLADIIERIERHERPFI
jgi:uncharacterized protein YmfQ (DUF2313 family)